jgi:putative ABC transport system permease protein
MSISLAWMQLRYQKVRLAVATAGIAFAVILILMQLGFRASLLESSVRYQERLRCDIVIMSPDTLFIAQPAPFSSRRLYQARGIPGVAAVTPLYATGAIWKNPWTHVTRRILAIGIDPSADVLDAPGVAAQRDLLRRQDALLFDALSRPEYGPVPAELGAGRPVTTEINDRDVDVVGLFEVGTSFGIDAAVLTGDDNFLRLFPARTRTQIDFGLVVIEAGADAAAVRDAMRAVLPGDVLVFTRAEWIEREKSYWLANTPIGAVFSFGVVVGLAVGAIIVYQILFADVSDHLPEYATLKAMGYSNRFVSGVVIRQAVILSLLGFVPGALVSAWLYRVIGSATRLPMRLDGRLGTTVLLLTIAMCAVSGTLALRKVRKLDPADVF